MIRDRLPPAIFVLFGATGDLARRKILPALYELCQVGELPRRFAMIALGRHEMAIGSLAETYRKSVAEASRHGEPDPERWRDFVQGLSYLRGDLTAGDTWSRLAERIRDLAKGWGESANVIYYLAVPPDLFSVATEGLGKAGLAADRARVRIVVEKPMGRDLASFRDLNKDLRRHFTEHQVFRIDHYLGKETVQNILALRFGNSLFEPVWSRQYVDHVAITVAEREGIGQRAGYYEEAGALRDMVQNHLLQLLCLVAMEPPIDYSAENLRNRKMDVLRAIVPIDRREVERVAVRGQYGPCGDLKGYREEPGVAPDSRVETYAMLKLAIENWRWEGVPFYLRSGKRLAVDRSEIAVRFRRVPHCFFPNCQGLNEQPAELLFQIKPEQGVVLRVMAKVPGYAMELRPVAMSFSYVQAFARNIPDAYETLLRDVLRADPTLFMRADQVEAAWTLLAPVLEVWANTPPDFPNYGAGAGWGPAEADRMIAATGRSWRDPPPGQ